MNDSRNQEKSVLNQFKQYNINPNNKKLTLIEALIQYISIVRDATFSIRYSLLQIATTILSIEIGYYIAFDILPVNVFLNCSLGVFLTIITSYSLVTVATPILICLTYKYIKKRKAPQLITSGLAFASQVIGTKYFIQSVGLLLNIVTVAFTSCYIFEGAHCLLLYITTTISMNLFVIGLALQACGLGELIINFAEFMSAKFFEPDCSTESYAEVGSPS